MEDYKQAFEETRTLWESGEKDEAVGMADGLARKIICDIKQNDKERYGKESIYYQAAEMNLLLFLIEYLAMSPNCHIDDSERDFGKCKEILESLADGNGIYSHMNKVKDDLDDPARLQCVIFLSYAEDAREHAAAFLLEELFKK